ncbi:MAG: hypothetical protein ABL857_06245 [Rickettsiales bacterium]
MHVFFLTLALLLSLLTTGIGEFNGINFIYNFFTDFMVQTVQLAVGALSWNSSFELVDIFSKIDDLIYDLIIGVPDPSSTSTPQETMNGLFSEKAELIIFFLALTTLAPPIFSLTWGLLITTFFTIARTMVSFLLSLVAIAFLMSFTPLFMCFMLFKTTFGLFQSWLNMIISYSIQPFIIFSIFILWSMVISSFSGFIDEIANVIKSGSNEVSMGPKSKRPEDGISICRLRYEQKASILSNLSSFPNVTFEPGSPHIKCCQLMNDPADITGDSKICDTTNATVDIDTITDHLLPPKFMLKENKFLYFLVYHLVSLLVVTYAFLRMLQIAPLIAQALSGGNSNIPLGNGFRGDPSAITNTISRFTSSVRDRTGKAVNSGVNRLVTKR